MLHDYLRKKAEAIPQWLLEYRAGTGFKSEAFLSSKVVYYPGAGTDGHPVKLFGSTGFAHCFVYADYLLPKDTIVSELDHPQHGFHGYHCLDRIKLTLRDLVTGNIEYHVKPSEVPDYSSIGSFKDPYGFLEILERDADFGRDHGPDRLAILFLGADGHATYDALFCQQTKTKYPCVVILQDHGFGGDYSCFGAGGLLERIAERCNVFPDYLLVAENTNAWTRYSRIDELEGEPGGMHNHQRFLFENSSNGELASRHSARK